MIALSSICSTTNQSCNLIISFIRKQKYSRFKIQHSFYFQLFHTFYLQLFSLLLGNRFDVFLICDELIERQNRHLWRLYLTPTDCQYQIISVLILRFLSHYILFFTISFLKMFAFHVGGDHVVILFTFIYCHQHFTIYYI